MNASRGLHLVIMVIKGFEHPYIRDNWSTPTVHDFEGGMFRMVYKLEQDNETINGQ